MRYLHNNLNKYITLWICLYMSVGVQILTTLKISNSEIRIGVTDVMLPLCVIYALYMIFKLKVYPEKLSSNCLLLLTIFSLWMFVSLLNGYFYAETLLPWAFVNKFIGWFILIAYFIVGIFIGIQNRNLKILFFRILIITTWVICAYGLMKHWLYLNEFFHLFPKPYYRIEGLFANPNAFGIFVSVVIIMQLHMSYNRILFDNKLLLMGIAICSIAVYYSYSRSAWLGLLIGIIISIKIDKKLISSLIFSILLAFLFKFIIIDVINKERIFLVNSYINTFNSYINTLFIDNDLDNKNEKREKLDFKLQSKENKKVTIYNPSFKSKITKKDDSGILERIDIIKRSIHYWVQKPVLGIGLGGFLWNSLNEKVTDSSITIHSSALWLLVETGIIGFLIFTLFIIACGRDLICRLETEDGVLSAGAFICIIFVLLGASIGTEVLYQRYIWILLGIALVHSKRTPYTKI